MTVLNFTTHTLMKISLIHPSRSRPERAKQTYNLWIGNASGLNEIEHILSLDFSDRHNEDYERFDKLTIDHNECVVEAVNQGAKLATGEIFVVVSDDFECPKNWDLDICEAFKNQKCKVLKVYDGTQEWIVTLPIMDRAYYEMQGYVYPPDFKHMFADTYMTHKAEIEGNIIWRNDLVFRHAHYSVGLSKKDEVNVKADSTWAQGEEAYLRHVKNCFGYEGIDVFNISGKQHLQWLKNKLGK